MLTEVIGDVINNVPFVEFVIVSPFSSTKPSDPDMVTLDPDIVVKVAAAGLEPPIILLFTVPPDMVKSFAT